MLEIQEEKIARLKRREITLAKVGKFGKYVGNVRRLTAVASRTVGARGRGRGRGRGGSATASGRDV